MRDALKGYLALAGSVTDVPRSRATTVVRALVASGEATAEQVTTLVDDLLTQTRQNREAVAALVTYEVDRTLGRVGLATTDEVSALVDRVRALEAEVRQLRDAPAAAQGEPAKKKAPARQTAASRTTPPARRTPARKTAPTKTAAP